MTEQKRRGRPPKAKPAAAVEGSDCPSCGQEQGHYDDCEVCMGVELPVSPSQAYAMRVWNGQGVDVPRAEKIRRVKRALEGQNLPFEGVELP